MIDWTTNESLMDVQKRLSKRNSRVVWFRFLGAGLELSGITLGFAAIGFGLDHWLGNDRLVATGVATLLGFSLGLARFLFTALKAIDTKSVTPD